MSDTEINLVQSDTVPCAICGGTKAEHEGRAHVWTQNPGELVTPKQQEDSRKSQQPQRILVPPTIASSGNPMVDRLITLLLDKGVIDEQEALHIAYGRPLK